MARKYKHMTAKKFHLFKLIRKHKRKVAFTLALFFFTGMIRPSQLFALTGGPSTPEVNAPSKMTTSKMVDPFTGNLNYSIPIMKVGDYPLSLSYNADVSMDQEASWVGLGWTLNPGSITRSVRGIPDDFKNDKVEKDFNTKPTVKAGMNGGINLELFGIDALGGKVSGSLGASAGLFYHNYQGVGLNYSLSPSIAVASESKGTLTASMGMNGGSHKNGITMRPSLSFPARAMGMEQISISSTFNSLSGLKAINLNVGMKNNVARFQGNFNSFADRSYKPKIEFPMVSTHGTFSFAAGGEIFGTFASGSLTGYYSQSQLKKNHKEVPAYGYFYTESANNKRDALLDFKRENDGVYTSNKPNLPIPNYTYDVFNISGTGLSGSFRAHRGDIGVVYDHRVKSLGGDKALKAVGGFDISAEIGGGNMVKVGIDLKTNNSVNTSGIWKNNNKILSKVSPVEKGDANEKYEPFYFRMSGEKQVRNNQKAYYDEIMGRKKAAVKLSSNNKGKALNMLHSSEGSNAPGNSIYKKDREKRVQNISYLTAKLADRMAISRKIRDYPVNSTPLDGSGVNTIDRLKGDRKKHHLSQITVSDKGKRYVYGIPAYNFKKKQVSFNVNDENASCEDGIVSYNAGKSNSKDNKAGLSHYYSSTTTPAYAYSYLLSSVVSEDYVDVSNDGPTPDDLGTYTRFNYSRIHKNYKWRSPYKKNKANFQENKYSLDKDNMANYMYGNKEIWYVNSIETRNYVAKFIIEDRKDGLGVKDENGGKNTNQKLKKLSKIELYTRADLKENGSKATPLKTAHFEYDYSLCPGVPNQENTSKGKLTLQKVYFTYGDSEKGRFSPYNFTYHSGQNNPSYKLKSSDRFGFYKKNNCSSGKMNNTERPYVEQDAAKTNKFVKAWKLKKVELPSGGTISIEYESDDYAYVQDKQAMEMFDVIGFSAKKNPSSLNNNKNKLLYQNPQSNSYKVNDYLFFKLRKPVSSREELKAYLPDEDHLYFKTKLDVVGTNNSSTSDDYEYISGFAEYLDFGVYKGQGSAPYSTAWIKLKREEVGDYKLISRYKTEKSHPIAKRAFNYAKNHVPKHVFKGRTDASDKISEQLKTALGSIGQMVTAMKSMQSKLIKRRFAQKVKLDKSLIRLNTPDGRKFGGGHRVKKIVMSDRWSKMTKSGKTSTYGKVFDYSTLRNGQKISSGVIAYEPRVGKEENPFYQPVYYKHNNDRLFMTKPFGESFFPGSTVGYSRVEIRPLPRPNANPAPAGYKVKKFFTAKDFPVITERTNLQDEHKRQSPFAKMIPFKFKFNERRAVSQGFKVVLNDMHGKPKAEYTYRHGSNTPFNGVEYRYKVKENGRLKNKVNVVNPDKTIEKATLGVDVDFVLDSRQQKSVTEMKGVNMNTDSFLASIIPIVIPVPLPAYKKETVLFRSMVASKVVRKKGIMDEVIAIKNGSKLKTKNLAFDAVTGKKLVTKTENKYGDYTYKTRIPAHHKYEGMEPAYQNVMASFEKIQVTNGEVSNNKLNKLLTKGDKLYIEDSDNPSSSNAAWVLKNNANRSVLIDSEGVLITDDKYHMTVIRSGYDNKAITTIGNIESMNNPISGNKIDLNQNLKVLNASAKKYKEDWQTYTGFLTTHAPTTCNCELKLQTKDNAGNQAAIATPLNNYTDFSFIMAIIQNKKDGTVIKNKRLVNAIEEKSGEEGKVVTMEKKYIGNRLFVTFKIDGEGEEHCTFRFWNLDGLDFPRNGTFSNIRYEKKDPYSCDDVHHFKVDYITKYKDTVNVDLQTHLGQKVVTRKDTATLAGYSECFPVAVCEEELKKVYFTCDLTPGDVVNPFVNGIEGIWRKYKGYDYRAERKSGRAQQAGYYKSFSPFTWNGNPSDDWVWTKETEKFNPFGQALEQKDPFGNYTANIYGYGYSRVKAVVKNSPHNQAGFDGFESYKYYDLLNTFGECDPQKHMHFYLPQHTNVSGVPIPSAQNTSYISDKESHTGVYSARVTSAQSVHMKRELNPYQSSTNQNSKKEYVLQEDDFVGIFTPKPGKYHVSAWVKDKLGFNNFNTVNYQAPKIKIKVNGSTKKTIRASGPLVDGWQQMNGTFEVPANANDVEMVLATDFGIAFFDDFRIHPYDAQMKAFVYNPFNLRHTAALDFNNYADFYQYNDAGEFIGTKKETSKGIITSKEARRGSYKSDK